LASFHRAREKKEECLLTVLEWLKVKQLLLLTTPWRKNVRIVWSKKYSEKMWKECYRKWRRKIEV